MSVGKSVATNVKWLNSQLFFGVFLALASAVAISAALISQYGFGLYPCTLCLYQRVPFVVMIVLGVLSGVAPKSWAKAAFILSGGVFAVGAGIAFYHVGVEQAWWQSAVGCAFTIEDTSLEALRAQIAQAPRALCTDVAWSLFGISMAGYNVMYSGVLAVISWLMARRV